MKKFTVNDPKAPWNQMSESGYWPSDICCMRSVGGRCYEHNPDNYKNQLKTPQLTQDIEDIQFLINKTKDYIEDDKKTSIKMALNTLTDVLIKLEQLKQIKEP